MALGDILSPKLIRLQYRIKEYGPNALQQFWHEVEEKGTPLIESGDDGNCLVTFLWRDDGNANNIAVIQDWGTDGIREQHMERLPGSDLWYKTRVMRSDTRTTYQLSPSPSLNPSERGSYQTDPLNPNTFTAFRSKNGNDILFSLLELPDAPPLPWRLAKVERRGNIQLHTPFEDHQRLWVYTPPTATATPLPVLVVFDGRLYKEQLWLSEILDYLIASEQIPPLVALMVDSQDRNELHCQPDFARYVANQLMPWLCSNYPVTTDPQQLTILGSSLGGLAALYLGFNYPHRFGKVFSQTGWFRWHPESDPEHHWLAREVSAAPKVDMEILMQVGNLEIAQMLDGGPSQLAANRFMRDTLLSKGYSISYQEYSGGHDASSLEAPFARGLVDLLKRD